mgnify:CR=1 FL=1
MERNKQVDIIRGVAILLVVLEHALGTSDNFFAKIILSFHMPAFFILSGYLAHEKITGNFGAIIKKKIKRLLIPQLTLAILSLLYNFFIGRLVLHTATGEELNIFYCFFRWWFLLVMAQVVIFWEVLIRICKNHLIEAEGILFGICMIYTFIIPQGVSGSLYIAVTPVAFGYYLAGNLIHKVERILKDKQIGEKITEKGNIVLLFISSALIIVLSLYNKPVLMYENNYGNVLIGLATAFLGYYILSDIAKLMHENAFLQWCGKNSIIIYVIHFSIVQGTRGILVRLLSLPMEILGWIVFVIAGLFVLALGKICERHFMFAFGK